MCSKACWSTRSTLDDHYQYISFGLQHHQETGNRVLLNLSQSFQLRKWSLDLNICHAFLDLVNISMSVASEPTARSKRARAREKGHAMSFMVQALFTKNCNSSMMSLCQDRLARGSILRSSGRRGECIPLSAPQSICHLTVTMQNPCPWWDWCQLHSLDSSSSICQLSFDCSK